LKINYYKFGLSKEFMDYSFKLPKEIRSKLKQSDKESYLKIFKRLDKWYKKIRSGETHFNLLFSGVSGSGKSSTGSILVKRFLEDGVYAIRMSMQGLIQTYFKEWVIPEIALTTKVLFIEEAGNEIPTNQEHNKYVFENILKFRIENELPTILASNYSKKSLSDMYGEVVESILENRYFSVVFPKTDLREIVSEYKKKKFFKE